jgi:hypothetical protein
MYFDFKEQNEGRDIERDVKWWNVTKLFQVHFLSVKI